jgi:hypothetical protein
MMHCEQGLRDFLRAYYHCRSADFTANHPHPLAYSTAEELAKLPMYYVMDLDKTMPETVAPYMPSPAEITAHRWLTEDELDIYVTEYERTGFQGAALVSSKSADPISPSCNFSPAARSTYRRCSSPAAATGMCVSSRARSSACRWSARAWKLQVRRRRRALAPAGQPEAVTDLLVAFLRREERVHRTAR